MSSRKLGRGLDALISPAAASLSAPVVSPAAAAPPAPPGAEVLQLDPQQVETNPHQPRKRFSLSELEELKGSISREGVLQPILVREKGGRYELVAGERRLRASRDLGLATIPAVVIEANDDRLLELALIENIHREDLNQIELAQAYRQLIQLKDWTQEELAQNLSLSRPGVANTLRLLDLPEDMQSAIARGQITMGHAKVLLSVTEPREQRLLFEKIAEEKLTVRDLESARSEAGATPQRKAAVRKKGAQKSPQVASLEEELTRAVGARVTIRQGKGKGTVTIEFYSNDDFERIRGKLSARG